VIRWLIIRVFKDQLQTDRVVNQTRNPAQDLLGRGGEISSTT